MKVKALIISIKGTILTKKESKLIINEKPWGIILFKRNLKSYTQIKNLTTKIRKFTKNNKFSGGNPISGLHLARTVARLKRGWMGAFVTTSTFSKRVFVKDTSSGPCIFGLTI